MTDITELAQKRNAAISRLSRAFEPGHSSQSELDALSCTVDVMNELVEALEKAHAKATQQGNIACALFDEVTQLRRHADEKAPELRAQLIEADSELEALRQRIAELESCTVTAENLQESAYRAGLTAGWNLGIANNNDGFNKCLAAHAAGIKWEAE
ncbi:TPA: hypothetical protein SBQ34_002842 [Raoultella ornithinolytica]|uniref:Ead/Ea22-like family protein n=1 Tax=Raoultella ornithinolytica TaxID=54291 RepID=A0ABZ2E1I0_RAOOR|nr:hypothetical protein [Raoultella ornithinolytica]HAT2341927.1 hypothetical protein [Raoultella ornithinolytica]HAT2398122.1 hypothetical protein [Raoultella ornithinolytica]HAT2434463.1 hypothetical protein [Raoultella ornithinolytica]HAT2440323.1 hypothetical protein [Raoultella ornithinolytica]